MNLGQWMGLLAIFISCYILWQIREILLLLFAAVVLATALNRLARRLQWFGIKRGWAVMVSILLLLLVLVSFFWLIVPPFATQLQQLTQLLTLGFAEINDLIYQFRTQVPPQLKQYLPDVESIVQQLQPLANQLVGGAGAVVGGTFGGLLSFLLVLVLALMMVSSPQAYRSSFVRLFPSFYRWRVDGILDRCDVALGGWLIGILFNMMVIGVLSWIGLLILGVPLALANGVLAGLLTFIPNIGPALSAIPPMAIALLDAPWKSLAVLGLYIFIQQLESNVLTPYVMAEQIFLLPAVTLIAQVFFASIFGFLGLFLALPLTLVLQVWLQETLVKDILDRWRKPFATRRPRPLEAIAPVDTPGETKSVPLLPSSQDLSPLDYDPWDDRPQQSDRPLIPPEVKSGPDFQEQPQPE
ncbi:AI-2E family transporter [Laspinema palackyanum]|uniref:AI-2E family transporter n=1 Tax=Laspinema palackyanum TaxID=3231601 RepID=UPI00345CF7FA|nr:AI-2E family transporter [Laspinema sp. D2c]